MNLVLSSLISTSYCSFQCRGLVFFPHLCWMLKIYNLLNIHNFWITSEETCPNPTVYCHLAGLWVTKRFSSLLDSSFQFSCSVVSNSLRSHVLQHTRLPCPSTLGACSNSCPSSRWCHPTILSSVVPFSSCLQFFPASGSFLMSQLFASGLILLLEFII